MLYNKLKKKELLMECKRLKIKGCWNKNKKIIIDILTKNVNKNKENVVYESMKIKELIQECKKQNITGYSNKRKKELISLLIIHEKEKTKDISSTECNNDIDLFYNKCVKKDNDRINKLREDFILKMFNTDTIYLDPRVPELKDQFTNIFTENIPNDVAYDSIILERKAGRGHNYDFLVLAQKNLFTQYILKVEFKYGNNIFNYPQFISIYLTNRNFMLVKTDTYVNFWYQNFLQEYMDCSKINVEIPSYSEYIRTLNSTNYTTKLQKNLYDVMKNDPSTQKKLYSIVDKSIEKYLKMLALNDIDFDLIENMIRKQMDKIFIFCKNGKLTTFSFQQFSINKNKYNVNKNTLLIYSSDGKFVITFLLRWKNYKGLSGPAWQVGIKKN